MFFLVPHFSISNLNIVTNRIIEHAGTIISYFHFLWRLLSFLVVVNTMTLKSCDITSLPRDSCAKNQSQRSNPRRVPSVSPVILSKLRQGTCQNNSITGWFSCLQDSYQLECHLTLVPWFDPISIVLSYWWGDKRNTFDKWVLCTVWGYILSNICQAGSTWSSQVYCIVYYAQ